MRSVRLESSPLLLLLLLCNKHSDNKQLVPTLVFLLLCSSQFGGVDAADVSNCSNAPSFFPFRKGSLQLTCPKGWIQQGTSCFYLPPLNLTWDEAAPYCGQSENQASSPLTLNDLFITHDLAQALGSPNEFFWTGYYFDPSESQSSLLSFYSSQKISLYSPLWAPNQPNLTYYEQITSTNDTQCVAFNPNICNETNFGWYLQPCSWKRRSICQTVACFDDDYRCKDNSACIPKTAICDGVQNCEDSSDEEHCSQSSKACSGAGEQLNAASGEVTFLGAQLNQVGEATCEWTIKSLDDRSLMLNFFSSHGDKDDRIEVGEPSIQKPADAIPLGRSSSWSSSTNHSVIRVHTKAVEKLRLHFQYYQSDDPNCNAHITKWSGVLRTPSVNPDSRSPTSCKWTITNENNSPIMLKLDQFDLADGDKFTISDGGGKNGETIYDFTTKNRNPANVYISSKPVMVVMFKSIRSSTRRANVMANFVQSCTNQKIEGNYGQIVINSKSDQQCSLMFSPSTTATLYLEEKRITDKDSIKIEENGVTKSFEEVFRISKPVILHTFSKSAGFKATFSYSQDCKVPALPVDMNWISEDAVKQNIPYRKTVRLKCSSDDLTMTGKPELTCALNGMWDSPPPVCLSQAVPVCPVPYIRHGHVTELLGIHLGDFLSFACNSGFRASTSGTCACTADGWTPKPTCHKVECKKPDKRYGNATLENERDDDDYDIGSLVLYACNGDSFVDDSVVRVCLSNGTWSNPDFHCKYRGCYAESVPFGSFNQTFVQVGQDDPIVCDSGCEYTDRVPVCQKNGWMPNKPRCDFGHPCDHGDKCAHGICVPLLNDYVCQCVNGFKSTADFKGCEDINECAERIDLCDGTCTNTIGSYSCSCPAGKILYTGHAGRRKIYDKYLVPNRSCIEQRCEPPRINSSGTLEVISNGLFLSGSTVTYVCLNTNKNFTITCSSTGEWDKPNLKINCEDNDVFCRSITGPLLSVTPRRGSYEPGSVVSFSCRQKSKQKVVLIGPEQLFCSFSGTWIGEQPVCTIPSCQSLENFNGTNKMSIFRDPFSDLKPYSVGDVVTFRCDPGYELVGNNVIECRNWENPRWNGTTPCCKANGCEVATLVGNDLLPSNDAIAVGETVTFQCRQKNYILSDDMPRTCVSEVPHMLKRRYKKSDCLVPLSPEKYVMQNESFVLWCVVKRECRSNQVVWKRGNETLHTQKASNGDIFYFHTLRAQMTDQGSYSCSVEDDQETAVDSRTTDVFVNQLEETESGQNWIDTIDLAESNYHPVMNDLMERHWTGSDEWVQSEGRWKFFSSAAGKLKRLVTPAIVLRSDVVEVRFKILDESNAHFNISYAASNDPTTPSREDQFKLVTGIETTPQMEKSTRIQIEVPNAKYVWFRVSTTDAGSAKLSNFNVFYTFCPKMEIGQYIYAETIASLSPKHVTGVCGNGAKKIGPDQALKCSKHGKWVKPAEFVSPCSCGDKGIDLHSECVMQGPTCYECNTMKGMKCSTTVARHCQAGEVCQTSIRITLAGLNVTKSCSSSCISNYADYHKCIAGKENCNICCDEDYCNWMPDAASQVPQLYPPPPTCLDQQPMKVECEKRVEVQVLKPHFFLPVDLPWPKVIDNDPFYLITSDLPNVSKNPYYFDGSIKHFQWVVTDRDGHAVTCDVDVIYKDEVSPVMDCPRVVIDMVPNTISRNTTLRLPDIPVVDTSTVHFVTSPQNGSTVSIDQPVLVNVTAIDWFGNAKLCQFWYQAKVADCPVWMINDGAFLCTMTEGISVCYFQISSKCILSRNLKALACKPGFGWRIIENNVEVNHFDKFPVLDVLPTCLEETEPSIAATVVFSSPDNLIGCVNESAKLLSVTNASLTECCSNIRWTFVSMKESKNDFLLTFLSNAKSESQLKECSNLLSASLSKRLTIIFCNKYFSRVTVNTSTVCPQGSGLDLQRRQCVQCRAGYYSINNECVRCPLNTYSNHAGATVCQKCPLGMTTKTDASMTVLHCLEMCQPGFSSPDGFAPCTACDRGLYQPRRGSMNCLNCPIGTGTATVAVTEPKYCRVPCAPGYFSDDGFFPCSSCPIGFYQSTPGQSECSRCPLGSTTGSYGATRASECFANDCASIGCQNNGTCEMGKCLCPTGFTGVQCDVSTLPCVWCEHGYCGLLGIFCKCDPGWTGWRCNIPSERCSCQNDWSSKCDNLNQCPNGELDLSNRDCNCSDGYEPGSRGACESRTPCSFNSCNPATVAHCRNDGNKAVCVCEAGYTGEFCERRIDGECSTNCKKGVCVPLTTPVNTFEYRCLCDSGYTGTDCSVPLNACQHGGCGQFGTCQNNRTFYDCNCMNDYRGENCLTVVTPCNQEIQTNMTQTCAQGGICVLDRPNQAHCKCPTGLVGSNCSLLVNRCTADSCHHGKCLERFNDIFCHCDEGYYGPRCENTIDPCDYVYQPCGEHGKCEMLTPGYEGTFNCSCRFPWRGNRCEKLDGCVQNKCHEHSRCVNVPSEKGYECICAKGFFGPLCDDPVHYCKYNLCLNNGVCVEDGHEGYRCDCKLGYEGKACQDRVDPCRNSTCYHGGTCVPNVKSGRTYVCECADGFSGQSCEQKTEPCALQSDYCQNGGSCKSVGSMAFCDCPNAYYGPRCEKEKTRDYNMYFTGDNTTQRIISPNFPSSFLKEFTICAWVRYETETTLDDNRIIEAPPFLILGPFNGSEVTSDLITMDNIGATVDRSRLNYTIKENEWHHVCLRSPSAANDKWNVLVDGLIKSTLVHPRVTPTPQRVLILLGGSRDGKKKFVGEISFVQFYHRSLEDIEVSNMAYYCSKWMDFRKGLTIDWSQFSTVERNNKAVLSLYPGICTTSQCLPGRVDCSKIRDSIPPTVIGCPKDIHIISPRRLTEVHWEPNKLADMFTDNVFITDFTYNYGSGDTFSWGIHRVVYIARDSAGNMAECHFDVTVSPNACEKPGRPLNGTVNYESPGSNPSELVAFVKCGNGSMYADEVPAFYTCDSMGRWNRHGFQDSRWSFPDCAEYTSPSQTITGFTLSLGSCLNGSTDSTSKLAQAIDEASKNFGGFCENNDCVGSHQLQTSVLCSANSGSRSKRAVEGNLIRVNFTLFVNNTRKDVRAYIENTVSEVYQNETYEVDAPIFLCSESDFPLLFASQNLYSCVECVAGTYWNGHQCIPCPPDTYQSKTGQRQCIHCPNKTTTGYYKGAKSLGDCYTICDAGDFFNFTTNNCERCDRGSYSSSPGQRICTPCPEGHTTTKWGSTNASDCSSTCEAGKFMKPNGSCAKCARGTYKTEESMRCTPCKLNGLTTASTGSASPNDCNVIDCPFGHYVAKDAHSPVPPGASLSKICLPCPLGTYQEMMNRTDCTKCPAGMTTVTEGSTSPDQCGQPGGCSPSDLHQCAENHSCRYQKDRGYVCMADSIVTMVPETSVAWYVWLIIGLAGAFLACVLLGSFAFLRFKYPNLFSCCESPQLKQMTTTSFYRNNAVTISEPSLSPGDLPSAMPQTEFPVVLQEEVKLEPSTNHTVQSADLDIAPMSDVFNEIYTGLHKLAESGVDETSYRPPSPSLPPTPPSPTYPRPRLTVETKRNRRNRFEFSVQHHDVNTSREMTFDSDDLPSAHRIRFNSSSFRYSVDKVAPFDFETQFPSMSEGRFASQFPSTAGAFDFGFGSGHLEQFEHKRDQASSAIASSFSTMQAHDPVDDDDDDYFG